MVAKDSVKSHERARRRHQLHGVHPHVAGVRFLPPEEDLQLRVAGGATDQWGNITVGTELTRKKLGATVWGLVFPLLTKSDGAKYGKTADGTVWLDPKKTSPYRFYQFFVNSDDADVIKLLKTLTFLSQKQITALETKLKDDPGARAAASLAGNDARSRPRPSTPRQASTSSSAARSTA